MKNFVRMDLERLREEKKNGEIVLRHDDSRDIGYTENNDKSIYEHKMSDQNESLFLTE